MEGQIFFAKLEGAAAAMAPLSTERAAVVLLINDQWGDSSRIDFPPKMLGEFGWEWGGIAPPQPPPHTPGNYD